MASDLHTLEPFPLFVDIDASSPNYFSKLSPLSLFGSSPASRLHDAHVSTTAKVSNYLRLRYYQYEVTFGLYMLTPTEKVFFNTIIFCIFSALFYALNLGLRPFLVRSICQLIYYLAGSLAGVEDLCAEPSCS